MSSSREPAVTIRGVSVRFGETAAVDDLTLEIRAGEVFGLLGPNGAGKTTTLGAGATLEDVFRHYAGDAGEANGDMRQVRQTRRTAGRLGYPVALMPSWVRAISHVNPLSYEVDALRGLLLGSRSHLGIDLLVLVAAAVIGIAVAASLLPRLAR